MPSVCRTYVHTLFYPPNSERITRNRELQRGRSVQNTHLAVAADADRGQQSGDGGEDPARRHDDACVSQSKLAVEPHSVRDGVPALQRDRCQREHRQLTGKHL